VRDLRVIRGDKGLFVAMPSRKRSDGTYSDIAHPLNAELRQLIETTVIGEFQQEEEKQKAVSVLQPKGTDGPENQRIAV